MTLLLRKTLPVLFVIALGFAIGMFLFPSASQAATLAKPPNNLGLVGYWNFNEGTSTSATDYSGFGNHGTTSNISHPSTATSGWTSLGKVGGAMTFDGANDLIVMSKLYDTVTNTFTMAMWIKPTVTHEIDAESTAGIGGTSGQEYVVFPAHGDGDYGAGHAGVGISAGTNGVSVYTHLAGTMAPILVHQTTITGWTHIAIVVNNKTPSLYINGVLVDTGSTPTQILHPGASRFATQDGIGGGSYGYFAGGIDEVRFYSRALGQTELSALYNGTSATRGSTVSLAQYSALSSGLVGHWTFDGADVTNRVYDRSSSGNNHGYFYGGATTSAKSIGKHGQSLSFDGVNDSVKVTNFNPSSLSVPYTFSLWARSTAATDDGWRIMIGDQAGTCCFGIAAKSGANNILQVYLGAGEDVAGSYTLNDGLWHHIVVVATAANSVIFYYDGVQIDTSNMSTTIAATLIEFGANQRSEYWKGSLDEIRIYNRALSASEVKQLYELGGGTVGSSQTMTRGTSLVDGLTGHWTFDGLDFTTQITNKVTGGNHGYLYNTAPTSTAKVIGKMGQGITFDGVNDVAFAVYDPPITSQTMAMWVKTTTTSQKGIAGFGTSITPFASNHDREFYVNANGTVSYRIWDGSNQIKTSTATINDGNWHHILGKYESGTGISIYVDGVKQGTTLSTGAPENLAGTVYFTFGVESQIGAYFPGSIDDVRFYDRALSDSEILQLYNIGR